MCGAVNDFGHSLAFLLKEQRRLKAPGSSPLQLVYVEASRLVFGFISFLCAELQAFTVWPQEGTVHRGTLLIMFFPSAALGYYMPEIKLSNASTHFGIFLFLSNELVATERSYKSSC